MNRISWTEGWSAFASYLQKCIRERKSKEEISQSLSGQIVHWCGQLERKNLNGEAPRVSISMPAQEIEIDAEPKEVLHGFSLPVADEDIDSWAQIPIGSEVQYSAKFLDRDALFPAFDFQILPSGKALIDIGLERGCVV